MRRQDGGAGFDVAGFQAEQYLAVVVLADAAVAAVHVDPAHEADARVDVLQHAEHFGVAGHRHQSFVEGFVQVDQFVDAAVARLRAGLVQEGQQGIDVLVLGPVDRDAQRLHLEHPAHLVQGKDFGDIELAAKKALARHEEQQSFGEQPGQRFAQRRTTDAERLGQHTFVEALARLELVADAHQLELFVYDFHDAVGGCLGHFFVTHSLDLSVYQPEDSAVLGRKSHSAPATFRCLPGKPSRIVMPSSVKPSFSAASHCLESGHFELAHETRRCTGAGHRTTRKSRDT